MVQRGSICWETNNLGERKLTKWVLIDRELVDIVLAGATKVWRALSLNSLFCLLDQNNKATPVQIWMECVRQYLKIYQWHLIFGPSKRDWQIGIHKGKLRVLELGIVLFENVILIVMLWLYVINVEFGISEL